MLRIIRGSVFLMGALSLATIAVGQQGKPNSGPEEKPHIGAIDLAVTYSLERAKTTPSNCDCFWLNGGSADGAVTIYRGLGVAANFTGEHASNVAPGVNFGKLSYMAGPRYTYNTSRFTKKHGTRIFGEWLFGGVHGFDSVFPGATTVTSTANAFSTQLGGGIDVAILKGFSVRALELDYIHTSLPNEGSNSQNDFRLAFGLSYRMGSL